MVLKRRLALEAKSNNLLSSPVIARALRSWARKYKDKIDLSQVTLVRKDQEESFDQKAVTKIGFN